MFSHSLQLLFGAGVGIAVLGILFREHMVRVIANEQYLVPVQGFDSGDVFVIVLFVVVFYFASLLFIYLLIAAKKQSQLLKINIFVTLINII